MGKTEEKKLERMGYVVKHDERERILIYEKDNPNPVGLFSEFDKQVIFPVYNVRAEVPLADIFVTNTLKTWISSFEGVSLGTWPPGAPEMHEQYQLVIEAKIDRQSMKTASELHKQIGSPQYAEELAKEAEESVKRLEKQMIGKLMLDSMTHKRNHNLS
jgi:hypothetical protein